MPRCFSAIWQGVMQWGQWARTGTESPPIPWYARSDREQARALLSSCSRCRAGGSLGTIAVGPGQFLASGKDRFLHSTADHFLENDLNLIVAAPDGKPKVAVERADPGGIN